MSVIGVVRQRLHLGLVIAALGCGSGGGGTVPDGTGGSGTGGDTAGTGGSSGGGNTGGGSSVGDCRSVNDLEEVLAPVELPLGSVLRYLAVDDDYVYFAGYQTLNRIPKDGGAHEVLWDGGEGTSHVPFFQRETDLVVVRGTTIFSVPKAGGDPTDLATLPTALYPAIDGRIDFVLDGDIGYFKTESGFFDDPFELNLYSVDLDSGESTLLKTTEIGRGSLLAKSGDALYIRARHPDAPEPTNGDFTPAPSALYRLPTAGGEFEPVTVNFPDTREFSFAPLGADAQNVFLTAAALPSGDNDFGSTEHGGLYSVPRDGGDATQLVRSLQLFNMQAQHLLLGDRSFFRLADANDKFYLLEAGTLEELLCVKELVFSIAADDQHLYLGVSPSGEEVSTIVRHPL